LVPALLSPSPYIVVLVMILIQLTCTLFPYTTLFRSRPRLSLGFSRQTRQATYKLFTPNNSGQRLRPTYYRGCWHVVSRRFFCKYRHPKKGASSLLKGVYNPKAVILHAASLHQTFVHCAIFPTAASRRSLGRISVPVWPVTLSGRLPITALVSHYPTNKLIGREPIQSQKIFPPRAMRPAVISGIRHRFQCLSQSQGQITHVLLTRSPLIHPSSKLPRASAFDLHVLSTPPAFVLSQDQTLRKNP